MITSAIQRHLFGSSHLCEYASFIVIVCCVHPLWKPSWLRVHSPMWVGCWDHIRNFLELAAECKHSIAVALVTGWGHHNCFCHSWVDCNCLCKHWIHLSWSHKFTNVLHLLCLQVHELFKYMQYVKVLSSCSHGLQNCCNCFCILQEAHCSQLCKFMEFIAIESCYLKGSPQALSKTWGIHCSCFCKLVASLKMLSWFIEYIMIVYVIHGKFFAVAWTTSRKCFAIACHTLQNDCNHLGGLWKIALWLFLQVAGHIAWLLSWAELIAVRHKLLGAFLFILRDKSWKTLGPKLGETLWSLEELSRLDGGLNSEVWMYRFFRGGEVEEVFKDSGRWPFFTHCYNSD